MSRAIIALLTLLSGCNIVGPVASQLIGPQNEPPEYAPAKDKPLLVFVENYRNPSGLQQQSDELAQMISEKLGEVNAAPMVPQEKLISLRTEKGAAFDKMKIPEIGRDVGAGQIIYVNLKDCSIEGIIGGPDVRCNVDAVVKVVDANTGKTLWPDAGEGREFQHRSDYNLSEGKRTEESIKDTLLDDLSTEISLLFIPHPPAGEHPKD